MMLTGLACADQVATPGEHAQHKENGDEGPGAKGHVMRVCTGF